MAFTGHSTASADWITEATVVVCVKENPLTVRAVTKSKNDWKAGISSFVNSGNNDFTFTIKGEQQAMNIGWKQKREDLLKIYLAPATTTRTSFNYDTSISSWETTTAQTTDTAHMASSLRLLSSILCTTAILSYLF